MSNLIKKSTQDRSYFKSLLKKDTSKITYIRRPKRLCSDTSSTESAIFHSLEYIKKIKKIIPQNIILLQPTSPFRTNIDIEKSIKLFKKKKYDSLFSAYEDKLLIWKKNINGFEAINYNVKKRKRFQNLKKFIVENGAIFIFNYKKFLKHKVRLFGKKGCYLMSKKNSFDIDDNYDLYLARKY